MELVSRASQGREYCTSKPTERGRRLPQDHLTFGECLRATSHFPVLVDPRRLAPDLEVLRTGAD